MRSSHALRYSLPLLPPYVQAPVNQAQLASLSTAMILCARSSWTVIPAIRIMPCVAVTMSAIARFCECSMPACMPSQRNQNVSALQNLSRSGRGPSVSQAMIRLSCASANRKLRLQRISRMGHAVRLVSDFVKTFLEAYHTRSRVCFSHSQQINLSSLRTLGAMSLQMPCRKAVSQLSASAISHHPVYPLSELSPSSTQCIHARFVCRTCGSQHVTG